MQPKSLERIAKGFSNHTRIKTLILLEREPNLVLMDIASKLKIDFRTAGEHTRKLAIAGLISKKHYGAAVQHRLTDRGKQVLKFCRTLE